MATVDVLDSGEDEWLSFEAGVAGSIQWRGAGAGVTGGVRGHATDACSEAGIGRQETIGRHAPEGPGNTCWLSLC